ncbi:MAG: UDP-glucose 4-epimerase GalE [Rhodospirillales bacterium]|nr:MAG: UDP-glucose 4-epimerase GalE [Rhodospirillales bacterium]
MGTDDAILITGGAGYIGSHAILAFREAGHRVVVIDDLSTGVRDNVPAEVPIIVADVADMEAVGSVIRAYGVAHVIHFAGSIVVPDSVADPLGYYRNNTVASRNLLEVCIASGVRTFVFSSTAAVYGEPEAIPVGENAPTMPTNPYGRSKLMTEWMLRDVAAAHGLAFVALRYFNVAGADPAGRTGQSTPRATHLIKVACEAAVGIRPFIEVFGDDYPTPDGTCIRDYIHVSDLAAAHVCALNHLESGGSNLVLNCGYGRGYSVKEVLDVVQRLAGRRFDIHIAPRRPGDPARLVCDPAAIRRMFPWRPQYDDLDVIARTALAWERKRSQQATAYEPT